MEQIILNYNSSDAKDWEKFSKYIKEKIIETLKSKKIYRKNLLYRGFKFSDLSKVAEFGTDIQQDENQIWAGAEDLWAYDLENVVQYAYLKGRSTGIFAKLKRTNGNFVFSIYDRACFEEVTEKGLCTLKEVKTFKDALLAIIIFTPER